MVKHMWVLEVVRDLRAYAEANDLFLSAEQLNDVETTVQVEISSKALEEHANDGKLSSRSRQLSHS